MWILFGVILEEIGLLFTPSSGLSASNAAVGNSFHIGG